VKGIRTNSGNQGRLEKCLEIKEHIETGYPRPERTVTDELEGHGVKETEKKKFVGGRA